MCWNSSQLSPLNTRSASTYWNNTDSKLYSSLYLRVSDYMDFTASDGPGPGPSIRGSDYPKASLLEQAFESATRCWMSP